MKICVIDIGSNTVKASVFKLLNNGRRNVEGYKGFKAKLVALIDEKDNGRFLSNEGKDVLYNSFGELIAYSEELNCDRVYAFATASLRNVSNSNEVLEEIERRFGVKVEILSGEEEALCSLRGLLSDECAEGVNEGVMIDMGGGSTEVVYFSNGIEPIIRSLNFGCLSLYKRFVKGEFPTSIERENVEKYVKKELVACDYVKSLDVPVFLIGGSARAVLKLASSKGRTLRANGSDFESVLTYFDDKDAADRAENIIPGRVTTVCPAAIAYNTLIKFICAKSVTVSESGVREGYLEKILP